MNHRDFYTEIVNQNFTSEVVAFAAEELRKLDAANEARRVKNAEKQSAKEAERAPLRDLLFNCITVEPKTAAMLIAEAEVEIKPQSVPSLLKPLIDDGSVGRVEVKTEKGKQRGYILL